jgi:hypothetical protein
MMHMKELFTARAWQDLVPDWSHTTLTGGYGTFGSPDYVTAERTPDGSLVLAYLPTAQPVSVDMTTFSAQPNASWYDPSSGVYTQLMAHPSPTPEQSSLHHLERTVGEIVIGCWCWKLQHDERLAMGKFRRRRLQR